MQPDNEEDDDYDLEGDEPSIDPGEPKWVLPIEPREVQLEALWKGYGKPGFAYFLRQRLGKTWLAYNEFLALRERGIVDWFLVICPNSLKEQWKEAIEQVDEYTPICIYNSYAKYQTDDYFNVNKSGGVFIINYESVKSFLDADGWGKLHLLRTYIVADESTKIKSPTAKMTKACLQLATLCGYKRVLTGKPSANNNNDFWAQLKFINATDRNFFQHRHKFTMMGGFQGKQHIMNMNDKLLRYEMDPVSYIAPDKYIKGFEKVYEPLRRVHMVGEQAEHYKAMEDEFFLELHNGAKITAPIALTKYLRLQQISSGVAGDVNGEQHNTIDPSVNPRIRVVKEILADEIDHKVIIVCRFKLSIKNLQQELTKAGYKVGIMVGGMGSSIEDIKREFNESDTDVLIAQIQVLSYGHTLHGNEANPCDSMIFYENDFSLLNRMQCESRPEKIEWGHKISYYDMYASKMDRYIMQSLRKKEDASMAIMGYAREYGLRPTIEEHEGSARQSNIGTEDRNNSEETTEEE